MKSNIAAVLKVLTSNLIVMVIGILTTLLVPKILGPAEFGNYQLFLFYSSYVGIALIGFCDGLYLIHGGKSYTSLDKSKFTSYFYAMLGYLLALFFISSVVVFYLIPSKQYFLIISVLICMVLQCLTSYFVLMNQATSRFNIYSMMNILEKLLFLIAVLFLLINNNLLNYKFLIIIYLVSKFLVLIINLTFDYEIVSGKVYFSPELLKDIKEAIIAGFPLTIAGIISMLIPGIGRWIIQDRLGNLSFGYYSLVFSLMSIITQVIVAFSIVLFPILKKMDIQVLKNNMKFIEQVFGLFSLLINYSYFFITFIIYYYLTDYSNSIKSLMILIPSLTFQSQINILLNNFFKSFRKEKLILKNGLVSVVSTYLLIIFLFNVNEKIEMIAVATAISYLILYVLSKYQLTKILNINFSINSTQVVSIMSYYLINIFFSFKIGFIIYTFILLIIFIKNRNFIKKFIMQINS